LMYKRKLMRLPGVFQQAGSFVRQQTKRGA
jgi:hypothetical protein